MRKSRDVFTMKIQNAKIPVILSMNVQGGVGTAFSTKLTVREINELETLIEKLINKHIKEQNE